MLRRKFMGLTSMAALAAPLTARARASGRPPNFVFFLIDDLGWRDLGCFGSDFYETPNIDSLARSGAVFTDAYAAAPVCSPTRAAVMAGKTPARLGTTDWFGSRRTGKVGSAPYLDRLPLEEVTVAEALLGAGYNTFFAGKWHLGHEPYTPENQGFQINKGGIHLGHPPTGYFSPYHNPKLEDGPPGEYLTDRLVQESLDFLGDSAEPFVLYLSHYAVHTPIQSKLGERRKYLGKKLRMGPSFPFGLDHGGLVRTRQTKAAYAGMIDSVDQGVGRVMDMLSERGLTDNTVVILTSDNGGLCTAEQMSTSNAPLRAGKGWLYEGGIRVPLIIRCPGMEHRVLSRPAISMDFYPTMLELAGLEPMPDQHRDGVSLVPLLRGDGIEDRPLYWHYPHYWHRRAGPASAVREGDLKLIHFYEGGRTELYDLEQDLGEKNDLSKERPEETARLKKLLDDWIDSVGGLRPPGAVPGSGIT